MHEGLLHEFKENYISDELLKIVRDFSYQQKEKVILNGQYSAMDATKAEVLQGSILASLFFLIYIYGLSNNLVSNAKLFADDTSLFFVVEKMPKSANDLNHDLAKIRFC